MSKIQEAIRRLQANGVPSRPVVTSEPQKEILGTLVREAGPSTTDDNSDNLRRIEMDFDLLRQAGLLAPTDQERQIADQYRLLKRPLLDNLSDRAAHRSDDANLIMVASALPGDGKTFNCLNLALSMATEKDKSVVLVDADVAKPHISNLFGLEEEPGLIDLLRDKNSHVNDFMLKTNVPGLRLLPAGRHDEHATELLASRRMASVVNTLSRTYPDRIVLFDSPPLLVTSEARVLASFMGQIVLVVCSGVTPQEAVVQAAESLGSEKAVSVVLNQASKGFGADGYGPYGGYGARSESPAV